MSAQVRLADALLRGVGGRTVLLRMPAPAVQGDDGEQLGLAVPQFQDTALGPVVFRRVRVSSEAGELLVSASAVAKIVGSLEYQSADVLFAQAAGVLIDGVLLQIDAMASAEAFGESYLYRLTLRAPVAAQL